MSRFLDTKYVNSLGAILLKKPTIGGRQRAKTSIVNAKAKNNKRSLEKSLYSLEEVYEVNESNVV